jgi:alkyldihydroxyacetonephosphate synthase
MAPVSRLDAALQAGAQVFAQVKQVQEMLRGSPSPAPQGQDTRFVPPAIEIPAADRESDETWGFADTRFEVNDRSEVVLTGSRYAVCGDTLPNLLPWIRDVMQVSLPPEDRNASHFPPAVPAPVQNIEFLKAMAERLQPTQWTDEAMVRLRRGHGHTQEEMYALKHGKLARVPDLVVWPESDDDVAYLVKAAATHGVALIPYGGGTNVTDALRCSPGEMRMIVAVDMKRMNRIRWIDPANRMACIEAGAVGRHIMQQLAQYGFTMGHEPDSVEFSTLGGWIATHASGMKKNRYGNIEDIVLDVTAVTQAGVLERKGPGNQGESVAPRESVGIDPRLWLFGSEGKLGIVTSAVVKLFPLPEVQQYGSVVFPNFDKGVAFLYELQQAGRPPASVRLVDNLQFQFSQALKPANKGWKVYKSKVEKLFVTKLQGFDPQQMTACTLVFEGGKDEVEAQEKLVYGIAKRHGGLPAGGENGARGYQLTFGIAYIRDFVMDHWVIAESFETSVPWSRCIELCENVKRRLYQECADRGIPGKPFVTCRVTQLYDTGVAVYFYFAFYYKGLANPSAVYAEIEHAAREEILRCGGSLSHHHGVGKIRQGFLPQIASPALLDWQRELKRAVDPDNIFGCNNQMVEEAGKHAVATAKPAKSKAKSSTRGVA